MRTVGIDILVALVIGVASGAARFFLWQDNNSLGASIFFAVLISVLLLFALQFNRRRKARAARRY